MTVMKKLTATGYVVRSGGAKVKRGELPAEERKRLAEAWSDAAMKKAGYTLIEEPERGKSGRRFN